MVKMVERDNLADQIGTELEPTPWHQVTQDQINQFADCTLDHQFIHVNPEAASATPFGGTIAHGFLTLSMLSHFAESYSLIIKGFYMGMNYGFDKVRFIQPVKVDSKIRARARILEITEKKPGQFNLKTEVTIEIEGSSKPALIAEWLSVQMVN